MKTSLRIATFNFLAGGSARRTAHWSLVRSRLSPDVLLTQEARPPPGEAGAHATALWTEALRGWGTGLYAPKLQIKPIPIRGFRGWITGGELCLARPPARPVRIFSIHCPPGEHGYIHTAHRMLDRFRPMAREADLILGGDFTVAVGVRGPDEPVKMSNAERAVMARLTDELGLLPCWQTANPALPLGQTLRWSGNRTAPYHCDGIFIPRAWKTRLASCQIFAGPEWEQLSDHNPVLAVLRR